VHDNLKNLGLDALDVVNLRVGGLDAPSRARSPSRSPRFAQLQQEGLIRHLGLSTVNTEQIAEAQSIAPVVCVQNYYNIANRADDSLIGSLADRAPPTCPYFPLGRLQPAAVRPPSSQLPPASAPRRWPSRWHGSSSAPEHPAHPRHLIRLAPGRREPSPARANHPRRRA